jgi:hypothetical protein
MKRVKVRHTEIPPVTALPPMDDTQLFQPIFFTPVEELERTNQSSVDETVSHIALLANYKYNITQMLNKHYSLQIQLLENVAQNNELQRQLEQIENDIDLLRNEQKNYVKAVLSGNKPVYY